MRRKGSSGKRREQKRKKREQRKRKAAGADSQPLRERMRRVARWPLLECRIGAGYQEIGMAQVLIARKGPGSIAAGYFLVDLGCLGVRECMSLPDLGLVDYEEFLEEMQVIEALESCAPELAVKVVEAGVAYAAELGFRPPRDYLAAREIFGEIDPDACAEPVICGEDGRPLYVPMPGDDVDEIIRRLDERVGPDGYELVLHSDDEFVAGLFPGAGYDGEGGPGPERRLWGKLRQAEIRVVAAATQHLEAHRGGDCMKQAQEAFGYPYVEGGFEDLFLPWAAFDWPSMAKPGAPRDLWPAARDLLDQEPERFDDFDRRFVESVSDSPFSFHLVEFARPGHDIGLRDLFTGIRRTVQEPDISASTEVGEILFTRVVSIDSVAVLVGFAPVRILPIHRIDLLDLRDQLAGGEQLLEPDALRAHEPDLRAALVRLVEDYDAAPSVLTNTDGDLLILLDVVFDLACTPREALSSLAGLAADFTLEELDLDSVEVDGELVSCTIPWLKAGNPMHSSWDYTLLGELHVSDGVLIGKVNSKARAALLRGEVEGRLGASATWSGTESIDPKAVFAESLDDLESRPEAGFAGRTLCFDTAFYRGEPGGSGQEPWRAWMDDALPDLGGLSPRDAARTAGGRDRLDALLMTIQDLLLGEHPIGPSEVELIRQELGLIADPQP